MKWKPLRLILNNTFYDNGAVFIRWLMQYHQRSVRAAKISLEELDAWRVKGAFAHTPFWWCPRSQRPNALWCCAERSLPFRFKLSICPIMHYVKKVDLWSNLWYDDAKHLTKAKIYSHDQLWIIYFCTIILYFAQHLFLFILKLAQYSTINSILMSNSQLLIGN